MCFGCAAMCIQCPREDLHIVQHIEVIGNLQISITPLGLFGGWLTATPPMGIIQPSSQTAIQLMYDVSQNEFQGKYQAQVLLTTTARPVAKVGRQNLC